MCMLVNLLTSVSAPVIVVANSDAGRHDLAAVHYVHQPLFFLVPTGVLVLLWISQKGCISFIVTMLCTWTSSPLISCWLRMAQPR